jgi:hypothetical protein
MTSRRLRRSLPVLVLLAGLVLPLAPAAAFSFPTVALHQSSEGLGSAIWAWLSHLLQATWEKNGMTIDPDGQPTAITPPSPHVDKGSQPDPNG